MKSEKRFKDKRLGIVVSDKSDKTIVVNVVRRFKHPKYRKYVHASKKYHAHDSKNEAKVGDKVLIIASRPYSSLKRWELLSIENRAGE